MENLIRIKRALCCLILFRSIKKDIESFIIMAHWYGKKKNLIRVSQIFFSLSLHPWSFFNDHSVTVTRRLWVFLLPFRLKIIERPQLQKKVLLYSILALWRLFSNVEAKTCWKCYEFCFVHIHINLTRVCAVLTWNDLFNVKLLNIQKNLFA